MVPGGSARAAWHGPAAQVAHPTQRLPWLCCACPSSPSCWPPTLSTHFGWMADAGCGCPRIKPYRPVRGACFGPAQKSTKKMARPLLATALVTTPRLPSERIQRYMAACQSRLDRDTDMLADDAWLADCCNARPQSLKYRCRSNGTSHSRRVSFPLPPLEQKDGD